MLALLKEKSKVGIANKSRKKYEAFKPEKKLKHPNERFMSELAKIKEIDSKGNLVYPPRQNAGNKDMIMSQK